MSALAEIEAAVEQLPLAQQEKLYVHVGARLESRPKRGLTTEGIEAWLKTARGAAIPGITAEQVMAMTRGEE
jgi:hypothetical protein